MSAFKKLERSDVFVTSHLAKKSWNASGSEASSFGIRTLEGTSGSFPQYPGDFTFEELLNYRSIRQLYYSNYVSGSLLTGSFENYLQSSIYNSESRFLRSNVGIVSIPRKLIGEGIEPGSISFGLLDISYIENESDYVLETLAAGGDYIEDFEAGAIKESGEGTILSDENNFLGRNRGDVVGDIIYTHGLLVFTDPQFGSYFSNLQNPTISWTSRYPIYTTTYKVKVKDYEFNYSLNPTSKKDSFGNIADNISGSEFSPYVTSIGLYNDEKELLAVAKLSRPVPKSTNTDMTFVINLDV